jgi:hypothetical protein
MAVRTHRRELHLAILRLQLVDLLRIWRIRGGLLLFFVEAVAPLP